MSKLLALFLLLGTTSIMIGNENKEFNTPETQESQTVIKIKSLELDGFRYIKQLHKDVDINVFWNNGVYGTGLTLSFFGEFDSKVHSVGNMEAKQVILEDGTELDTDKIRLNSKTSATLGNDKKSFGLRIDLDTNKVTNFKSISGNLEVKLAKGIIEETSGLLEDKVKSKEDKLGISVETASKWLITGRYFVLLIENADNIQGLGILDEKGTELKQLQPFSVFGSKNDRVKVYVEKEEGKPFSVRLTRAEKLLTQIVPFAIENIDLMSY